ncbi:TetR/AcrR family transcriptional regulator [Gordonia neofelifaecis]|uniref:Transcriptional regulator n=1 Tax=Gordonia neofelifaecis NRRL B-59395 TaxID=644548 RepID=F1YGT8_9ACTN|nr:TetR/AcrR family transcriptional regulator [Gordonia neofelifaecis]EGD56236.1 transcriptional regulator [Gordonia neofelifaecis NRRL B-59395]
MVREAVVRDYGGVSADGRRRERRDRLIGAGRALWGDGGLNAVSVRGVCKQAGLVHRYFYEHFAGRDELIVAVSNEIRDDVVATLVSASASTGGDAGDRLRAALTALLQAIADDPRLHRILSTNTSEVAGLENRRRETVDLVADLVIEHGAGLPGLPSATTSFTRHRARFIVGGVDHLIADWLDDRDLTVGELADLCTRWAMAVAAAGPGGDEKPPTPENVRHRVSGQSSNLRQTPT